MIIVHYILFTNFSIYMNVLKDIIFNAEEFYEQETKISGARNSVIFCQVCNIDDFKIYTLYCEHSKYKPEKVSVYKYFPYNFKYIQKQVNDLICLLLNTKGVNIFVVQALSKQRESVRNIKMNGMRNKILVDSLQSFAHGIDYIYKSNFTITNIYRELYFKCRFSRELHKMKKRSVSNDDYYTNYDLLYLSDGYPIPPHTASANKILPLNEIKKNSTIQNFFARQNVRKIVAENSHLTLNCPETTMDLNVQWYKDNEKLNSSLRRNMADAETEPHLTIDAYNSLYILQATKNEEGVYTCYVNEKPFQTYLVIVVSKSKLLNEEFFRYSLYLGFVLSLTITCYCAGICVAWHQRSSFADPLL